MKRFLFPFCLAALGLSWATTARADVTLPAVIGSHMVLQRDRPLDRKSTRLNSSH